jgi:hypothetical protein
VIVGVLLGLLAFGTWWLTQNGGPTVVTQTRSVAPFAAIDLAGSNLVTVRVGEQQSDVVRARKDMVGMVTTRVLAGHLVIANAPSQHGTKGPMSVTIGVPSLKSVTIARTGSGVIAVTGVSASSLTVTLAGSGVVRASGTASRLNVSIGGSGDAELDQLIAGDAIAVVSGSGRVVVNATRSLNASVTGDGVIQYRGNPARLATSVTGNGAIIPG